MKTVALALGCLLTLSHVLVAGEGPADERAAWEARIKKVQIGMSRAEVEKILPPYVAPAKEAAQSGLLVMPYTTRATMTSGGSQATRYYVSPGWCVSVCYDYTGVTPENSKGVAGYEKPENKLLTPVTLDYQLESSATQVPVKVK